MPRFFIPPENIRNDHFILTGSEAHHAAHVLRMKAGDSIDLFDGQNRSYQGKITSVDADKIVGHVVGSSATEAPSGPRLILYQALIKAVKWDWLVEKACEVGVAALVPLLSARTLIKPSGSNALERWQRIALAASKQCGRNDVMSVEKPITFSDAIQNFPKDCISLIPWEKESSMSIKKAMSPHPGFGHLLPKGRRPTSSDVGPLPLEGEGARRAGEGYKCVNIFIGPEGGWETAEVEQAQQRGVISVRLGPTLLRSETAGIVAATLALSEVGLYA